MKLVVSIVTYKSDPAPLEQTLELLEVALVRAKSVYSQLQCDLVVIENDIVDQSNLTQVREYFSNPARLCFSQVKTITPQENLGYGGGHNLAILDEGADFNLVLNPDVLMSPNFLLQGLEILLAHKDIMLLGVAGVDQSGQFVSLCKRYPTVLGLYLRGWAPQWLKNRFLNYLQHYEMQELEASTDSLVNVDIVSGCCMLAPAKGLREIGGFDERFFLYFEDFDLCLRIKFLGRVVYVPSMKISHYGGNASKKGWLHVRLFLVSAFKFFRKHGWIWF